MDWLYCNLIDGRLVDEEGDEINPNFPSFETEDEADKYIGAEGLRLTVISTTTIF